MNKTAGLCGILLLAFALLAGFLYCETLGRDIATGAIGMAAVSLNLLCLWVLGQQQERLNALRLGLVSATLDHSALDELCHLTKPEVTAVIRNYLDVTPRMLRDLRLAIANNRPQDVVRVSNRLRSAGTQMGAVKFAKLTRDIAYSARAGDLDPAPQLFAQAMEAYGYVDDALTELQKR